MIEYIGNVKMEYIGGTGGGVCASNSAGNELLDTVKIYREEMYSKIIADKQNWPALYNLSHYRRNLLEWIPISKDDTVLEIGSACGALSGLLADKAQKVTCVEPSETDSLANAYRNQHRDNLEILVGDFETAEKALTETYDYIVMVGVLENSANYVSGPNCDEKMLVGARKHLKPGGKLVVATENKLGMKYWAGCCDSYSGRMFESIEGHPKSVGIQTYTRPELKKMLEKAGYVDLSFYYPYPDYKLPLEIYSDAYLPNSADLQKYVMNYDQERLLMFDEAKAFDSVMKADAFPLFANSFLIIAQSEDAK